MSISISHLYTRQRLTLEEEVPEHRCSARGVSDNGKLLNVNKTFVTIGEAFICID